MLAFGLLGVHVAFFALLDLACLVVVRCDAAFLANGTGVLRVDGIGSGARSEWRLRRSFLEAWCSGSIPPPCACSGTGRCAGYEVRDGQCLYRGINEAVGRREKALDGCDPASFGVLARNTYAKDATRVWYQWHPVEGADADSDGAAHSEQAVGGEGRRVSRGNWI